LWAARACIELRTEHLKGRFEAYRFPQKSLLIGSDMAHDFLLQEGATELKKITGGDLISAEKKGSTEVFH
jgi:phage/plasmid-associated DNA primase